MERTNERIAMRVSRNSIVWNVALFAVKLYAGLSARSAAMVSDAVHSLSDVVSTGIVMAGVKLAGREADTDHPYGHERFECVAAILLSAILFATGAGIGLLGIRKIGSGVQVQIPGLPALYAAVLSLAVKEAMYWYTRAAAKQTGSGALMADAWHHRSDALSSIGSFAGILGARVGAPMLDPVAGIVISLFIAKAAIDIFRDAVGKMTDRACDAQTEADMRQVILAQPAVESIDQLKTRLFGDRIYVDVEIGADGSATLETAHGIAQGVHDAIEARFPKVKHCIVHVNPAGGRESEA